MYAAGPNPETGSDILFELFTDFRQNIKIAFKSVRFNLGQYASFFAALFLIQCFFGMLTVSSDMNTVITEKIVHEEYDYDIVFLDLNYSQMVFLRNDELIVFATDHIYNVVRIVDRYHYADNTTTYDVYIDFIGEDMQLSFKSFKNRYLPYLQEDMKPGQALKYNYSEIYKLSGYQLTSLVSYVAFAAIMTIVSILLITSIYRIRVNHYKFTYGIYMSFGADYIQLCKTSFWEMMVVSLVTFIPSQLFSTGVIYLIYRNDGFAFHYDPMALVKIFVINVIIVAVSVCVPMWWVSRMTPTKLIVSEDNSNLVSSPRRSFDFYNLSFPRKYELASMWRFRKYLALMIVTAVGFSAIFVTGFYVADFYKHTLDSYKPQFTAELADSRVWDEYIVPDLAEVEGVERVVATSSADAASYRSNMLIEAGATLPGSNLVVPEDPELAGFRATNTVYYVLADESAMQAFVDNPWGYKIKGDPMKMMEGDGYAVVSNYIDNKKVCDYEVGDKIRVGCFVRRKKEIDYNLSGNNRLRQELSYYVQDYVELEVCAVVDGMTTLGGSPVYIPKSVYRKLTAEEGAEITKIDIYVPAETTMEEAKETFDRIREYTGLYSGKILLTDLHTISNGIITRSLNYYALIIAISFLVLAISPLIWFFSQTLFVKKREKEFSVLLWLGTIKTEIRRLCRQNGITLAITSAVSCISLSLILIKLVQIAVTRIPPAFYGGTESYYFGVKIPLPALIASLAISIGCGYISSVFPLGSFFKRFSATENSREFSASEDD